ncbi:hypothetical protein [Rivularia sp. UHCC 0363]|uniref:hypothetical protein n=1 Tax=Rivularia sp. UHCC 0363 TaxID=3110244 RepID=UPI002B209AB9|nr:hypothetical protein [Rivularia sp. UHCC 0363]MEA5593425.1 hypothetical protein [Rivularia sp. UHCC 0363]
MLKSYQAVYENGHVIWLTEQPEVSSANIIVTILPEHIANATPVKRRVPPASMAGKVKILGDIVSPIVDEEDWQCLK